MALFLLDQGPDMTALAERREQDFPVRKIPKKRELGLLVVTILLGCSFFSMEDRTAAADKNTADLSRIRVEDHQDFTRIVFPCERPEETSVKPDLDRGRFLVRFPPGTTRIAAPRLAKDHPLIKRIEILSDPEKGVQAEVVLVTGSVDWVSYRYNTPPRAVLYLKARSGPSPSRNVPPGLSVSQKGERIETKQPGLTLGSPNRSPLQAEKPSDLVKTPRARRDESGSENLWRSSAKDIPEFVRLGTAYPPDFHEIGANERRLYLQALERFRNRDFSRAREIASKIVPGDPLSSVAETLGFFRADCSFRIAEEQGGKMYLRAIEGYRQVMARFPESRFLPNAILAMATGYRRVEFFQEALVQYQFFLTRFPENPAALDALFWQGECLFQMEKYREAKKIFGEFAKRSPRSIHGRIAALRMGDCLYKMGDLKRARQQYGVVLSETSDISSYLLDSLFLAGRSFLENRDFQEGREILFRAVNLDPGSEQAVGMMELIAQSYLDENRDGEALRVNLLLWESFGRDDPNGVGGVRLADMRLSRPQVEWPPLFVEAYLDPFGVYQEFLDRSQDKNLADEVMYRQSLALVKGADLDQAVTKLKRILSRSSQDTLRQRSSCLLAYCLNSLIEHHHGRSEPLEVIRLYKDNANLLQSDENKDKGGLLLVAENFQSLGLLEDALAVYQHVKSAGNVSEDHVLFQIGRVLSLKGDRDAARKVLEGFPKTYPRSPYLSQVQKLLGDLSLEMQDYRAAIKWYRLTLARNRGDPDRGRVYAHLGQALKARGRYKEAIEAYKRAIAGMWPFREQTWAKRILGESLAELAVYHEDRGRMPRAVEYYRRIVRLSPSEEKVNWALYRLGESHRKMGNLEMMRQAFEDLNKRSTDSLWTKLAEWTAGDAAFEANAGPDLGRLRKTLVKTKKK